MNPSSLKMGSTKMDSSLMFPNSDRKLIDEIPSDRRAKLCTQIDYTIHQNEGYWEKLVSRLGFDETHSKKFKLSFEMHGSPTDNLLRDCSYRMVRIRHLYQILIDIGLVHLAEDFLGDFDTEGDLPPCPMPSLSVRPQDMSLRKDYQNGTSKRKGENSKGWMGINTIHFDFDKISEGTNNFSSKMELGAGAFGKVYKVILNNTLFACKVLKIDKDNPLTTSVLETCRQHDDLRNELNYLAEYRHPNVIALYGWSLDGPDPCLIYDYMKNGSLQDRLQCLNDTDPMTWDIRAKVSCGAARGLQFLHHMNSQPLIHGDIKTANILLDESYTAKLGDFGLAREMPRNASTGSYIRLGNEHTPGTLGYLANEYIHTKKLSVQVDTYAFGVVLLELYTGRRAYDRSKENALLRDYMDNVASEAEQIGEEQASEKLYNLQDPQISKLPRDLALTFVRLALQCCHEKRTKRPKMASTLARLEEIDQEVAHVSGRRVDHVKRRNGPVESVDNSLLIPQESRVEPHLLPSARFQNLAIHTTEDDLESQGDAPSSTGTSVSGQYHVEQADHHHCHDTSDIYSPGSYTNGVLGARASPINPYGLNLSRISKVGQQQQQQQHAIMSSQWHNNDDECAPGTFDSFELGQRPASERQVPKDLPLSASAYSTCSKTPDDTSPSVGHYPGQISAFKFPTTAAGGSGCPPRSRVLQSPVSVNPVKESMVSRISQGDSYTQIFADSGRVPTESSSSYN